MHRGAGRVAQPAAQLEGVGAAAVGRRRHRHREIGDERARLPAADAPERHEAVVGQRQALPSVIAVRRIQEGRGRSDPVGRLGIQDAQGARRGAARRSRGRSPTALRRRRPGPAGGCRSSASGRRRCGRDRCGRRCPHARCRPIRALRADRRRCVGPLWLPSPITAVWTPLRPSMRDTVPSSVLATHSAPCAPRDAARAMADRDPPNHAAAAAPGTQLGDRAGRLAGGPQRASAAGQLGRLVVETGRRRALR